MAEQWIEAAQAQDIVGDTFALCARLHAGLVKSRARLIIFDGRKNEDVEIRPGFWWAEGHEALNQNWVTGDFSTWIERKAHVQAFGVTFALSGVIALVPIERRAIIAKSLSVIGLPPEKWSSLRYGLAPCGGCFHGTEEAYG